MQLNCSVICAGRPISDSGHIQGYATFQKVRDHSEVSSFFKNWILNFFLNFRFCIALVFLLVGVYCGKIRGAYFESFS